MKSITSMPEIVASIHLKAQSLSLLLFSCIAAVILSVLLSLDPSSLQAAEKVPCMAGEKGPGSAEQQKCLEEHIPGFGGWYYDSRCTMIVYLTDQAQEETARAILESFFKEMDPGCGNSVSVTIRKGHYKFSELSQWSFKAFRLLNIDEKTKLPGIKGVGGVPFFDNQINIYVEKEETITRVKHVLREHDMPVDAFTIRSKEAELKQVASIAPSVHVRDGVKVIRLPAVLWSNEKVGELVLGQSTLQEVTRMLPAWPGHGPAKPAMPRSSRSKWLTEEMHMVLDKMRYGYNPKSSNIIAGFNKKKRLIFVQYALVEGQEASLEKTLKSISALDEVYRDERTLVMRGKIGSCVLVETTAKPLDEGQYRLNGVVYFYLCDPETKR